jgi:hypothetical protein
MRSLAGLLVAAFVLVTRAAEQPLCCDRVAAIET